MLILKTSALPELHAKAALRTGGACHPGHAHNQFQRNETTYQVHSKRGSLFQGAWLIALVLLAGPFDAPAAAGTNLFSPSSGNASRDLTRIRETLADKARPRTWVLTGDSITHGAKHTAGSRSYVEHFAERLRWEMGRGQDVVINTGLSGDRADGLLRNFDWRIARF